MNISKNHIFIGNHDKLRSWAALESDDILELDNTVTELIISKVRELIKNYLQLDNVNFLFGTGSSIHLGAASIQNIPIEIEEDIISCNDNEIKECFKTAVQNLQKALFDKYKPETDKLFHDNRDWSLIYDGTYIRNYILQAKSDEDDDKPQKHYGEILVMLEYLLNYLLSLSFQKEAENDLDGAEYYNKLISKLKESLFKLCDINNRTPNQRDLDRIKEKGFEDIFKKNKYIFHEKFLKSLMQRPLNLQRANIFTSNYDLAFEYAFDNLGIKYIDGFSGFHHRYFKPETFNYDIFYPGSTTTGKVQRIEKVIRYFKLHGSISWIKDKDRSANNIYGIEEMPIELIKFKEREDGNFSYGNLMIYPTAVKKNFTLDLPYSELFRHFAYCISQPQSVLFTIGYSFCDDHFNDIIYQALSNPSFTLIIIDLNGSSRSAEIKRLKELNDPRIIIIEGNFLGDFITLADTLMPDFLDKSYSDSVAETLNALIQHK